MKKKIVPIAAAIALLLFLPQAITAIPAFARKTGFNCNMCHTAFPKLNDFGQRYRDHGYQIPGQEGREPTVFETAIPLALRTSVGHTYYHNDVGSTSGFHLYGLDLLAAGVLHRNISFLLVYTPRIDDPAADYLGSAMGRNPSQLAAVESASLVFSNLVPGVLNLKVGRFEPAYGVLSSRRTFYLLQPYAPYQISSEFNSVQLGRNVFGIEAFGHLPSGLKYGLGVINGNNGDPDNNVSKDFYFSLSQTFGKGEGQSAGQRIGIFAYLGRLPEPFTGDIISPVGDSNDRPSWSFSRLGAHVSLNWRTFNLQALVMRGSDSKESLASTMDYRSWSGFIQLDWAGLLNNRLVLSTLYNWVQPPDFDKEQKFSTLSALARYYLGSWQAVNISLHAEYSHRRWPNTPELDDDLFSLLLDFAF